MFAHLALGNVASFFTRLTNSFSKKIENHSHAVSFYFMVYNFVKVHGTIKITPAIKAGVTSI